MRRQRPYSSRSITRETSTGSVHASEFQQAALPEQIDQIEKGLQMCLMIHRAQQQT